MQAKLNAIPLGRNDTPNASDGLSRTCSFATVIKEQPVWEPFTCVFAPSYSRTNFGLGECLSHPFKGDDDYLRVQIIFEALYQVPNTTSCEVVIDAPSALLIRSTVSISLLFPISDAEASERWTCFFPLDLLAASRL
jgi:hypothetical protein